MLEGRTLQDSTERIETDQVLHADSLVYSPSMKLICWQTSSVHGTLIFIRARSASLSFTALDCNNNHCSTQGYATHINDAFNNIVRCLQSSYDRLPL
jgi:hypothetical protein